jgi:uncharacterized protein YaaQ
MNVPEASTSNINQLVILVVSGFQADELMRQLNQQAYYFTKIDSSGGLLHEPTICMLIGLDRARLSDLLELTRQCCQPTEQYLPAHVSVQPGYPYLPMIEVQVGGAMAYLTNIERFEQL